MNNILVTQSSIPPRDEYFEEISDIWKSHWMTNMGAKHKELQEKLEQYLNVNHVELLTNGHMALELSIQAMQLKGEVITTPFTFASTTHAIVRNGLTPVFCDINPTDFTMDVSKIESLITKKTSAILPVHVYGNICDVEKIENLAKKYNLKVIYDAAHAFGETSDGVGVGNFGDASCFSFHATKVFNTIEGGAVTFNNPEFGLNLYQLKNFGIRGPEEVDAVGANAKMNEFCAAMGICNLRHLNEEIEKRKNVYERYVYHLSNVDGLRINIINSKVKSNYSYFPIIIDNEKFGTDRDTIFCELEKNGIGARKYFYPIASEFGCYRQQYDAKATPIALEISKSVLTLPMYAELDIDTVDRICKIVCNCVKK